MDIKHAGLRSVALLEAGKGLLVLLTALALFRHLHSDWQAMAEQLVTHLHLNPARHYPHILLQLSANITEPRLLALGFGALFYVAIRWLEAYGLWRNRNWAAMLGIISSGLYLPFEIVEIAAHPSRLSVAVFLFNLVAVAVIWWSRPRTPGAH